MLRSIVVFTCLLLLSTAAANAQSANGSALPTDEQEEAVTNGPDFSEIDSQAKVIDLFNQGKLEKLYLLPLEFGGADRAENIVFVPPGMAALKASTDRNVVGKLAAEGKVTRYNASPKYSGKSFIPISIEITASDPGSFVLNLAIWGEGLKGVQR
jgi:hypothetical protein